MKKVFIFSILLLTLLGCNRDSVKVTSPEVKPPMAAKKVVSLEKHGHVREHEYFWLNDRENKDVIQYLNDENAYAEAKTAHREAFMGKLFQELKGRIKQDDSSVPYAYHGYSYYYRMETGKDYPIYCRKKEGADEEVLIDVNELAKGHRFFSSSGALVTHDNKYMSYSVDTTGRRLYTLYVVDFATKAVVSKIENMTGNYEWANDHQTIFYSKQDPQTLRPYQIFRHKVGTSPSEDVLVFEEKDETFRCYLDKSKTEKYIIIECSATLASECLYLDADQPDGAFEPILPREENLIYSAEHHGDSFYILTNDNAKNFRLMKSKIGNQKKENWIEVIPHKEDTFLSDFSVFEDFLVTETRHNGLPYIHISDWELKETHALDFGEEAYTAHSYYNVDYHAKTLRYRYESMTTPNSVFDYHMVSREKELKKQDEVLGGFNAEDYETKRIFAPARDGVKIPMTIVYRKDRPRDGSKPFLLKGYGSYGVTLDPDFDSNILSLLDRGFGYGIAHIRGSQMMGRQWYEEGKLLKKKNTFTDFIDCTKFLIHEKYASSEQMYATGGSAGGLLMGAVLNMEPQLYKGIVAAVPFVDVVTTMLDDSIPLTTSEYDEWGNPNEKVYYDYMLSYSPYDQVAAKPYTNLLVTTGLHDSQVQYWEPAKWVARLRAKSTSDHLILLKTNMNAGHGGASGRDEDLKEDAFKYSFILDLAGINE